jgi:hypothetical protein
MVEYNKPESDPATLCECLTNPQRELAIRRELGMDDRLAEVALLACPDCGQWWLRYFYEIEAFPASGRWYLAAVTPQQAINLTAENAKATLAGLSWYFYGGSYFRGRSGRISGPLLLVA